MSANVQLQIQSKAGRASKVLVDGQDIAGICGQVSVNLSPFEIPRATVDLIITKEAVMDLSECQLQIGSLEIPASVEVALLWLLKKREASRHLREQL